MNTAGRVLIFVHVPKACGTTLIKLLARWFPADAIYSIGTRPRAEVVRDLVAINGSEHTRIQFVAGHAAFGLHEVLAQPADYITVLRDPVERLVSHFHYARRNPRHPLHEQLVRGEMGIVDLARRRANLQTRYLGGSIDETPDATTLARAQANIEKYFALAGIAERFEETVLLLHRIFGRRLLPFASENVRRNTHALASIEASTLRALRREHEIDYELYDFVRARFAARAAAQDSPKFRRAVARLQMWNRAASGAARVWERVTQSTVVVS
jgi:hypothetical protein